MKNNNGLFILLSIISLQQVQGYGHLSRVASSAVSNQSMLAVKGAALCLAPVMVTKCKSCHVGEDSFNNFLKTREKIIVRSEQLKKYLEEGKAKKLGQCLENLDFLKEEMCQQYDGWQTLPEDMQMKTLFYKMNKQELKNFIDSYTVYCELLEASKEVVDYAKVLQDVGDEDADLCDKVGRVGKMFFEKKYVIHAYLFENEQKNEGVRIRDVIRIHLSKKD